MLEKDGVFERENRTSDDHKSVFFTLDVLMGKYCAAGVSATQRTEKNPIAEPRPLGTHFDLVVTTQLFENTNLILLNISSAFNERPIGTLFLFTA